jgi:hypothetical protein
MLPTLKYDYLQIGIDPLRFGGRTRPTSATTYHHQSLFHGASPGATIALLLLHVLNPNI